MESTSSKRKKNWWLGFGNFLLLDDCVSKIEDVSVIGDISVPADLKQAIATHLDELAKSLDGHFPTRESYPAWVRQPFTFSVETTDVNYEYLDEIIEIQQNRVQQQLFRKTTLSTFWCQQMVTYPVIPKKALEIFLPFYTTYLCEQSFSRMLDLKRRKGRGFVAKMTWEWHLQRWSSTFLNWSLKGNSRSHTDLQQVFIFCCCFDVFVFVWKSCFAGFVVWTVMLMHSSFCATLKHIPKFWIWKKSYFIFPIKKGSVNALIKLVGFSTSNKVKNHCIRP